MFLYPFVDDVNLRLLVLQSLKTVLKSKTEDKKDCVDLDTGGDGHDCVDQLNHFRLSWLICAPRQYFSLSKQSLQVVCLWGESHLSVVVVRHRVIQHDVISPAAIM